MLLKEKYEHLNLNSQREFKKKLKEKNISPKQFFDNHSKKPLALLPLGVFLTYAEILNITRKEILREEPRMAILISNTPKNKKKIFTQQTPQF